MIETRIIGSFTEIYAGGGNFLTQKEMTKAHTFHGRILLTSGQPADDWQEVTPAQRAALEAEDAAWVRPEVQDIDIMWQAVGGMVFLSGEIYGLNGLNDLSLNNVVLALLRPIMKATDYKGCMYFAGMSDGGGARTNICRFYSHAGDSIDATRAFSACGRLEVVALATSPFVYIAEAREMFKWCSNLKKVITPIVDEATRDFSWQSAFMSCEALEEVRIKRLRNSISFADSPHLSDASISYIINNAEPTRAITLTLHPEAYGRVPDDLFEAAAEKNIAIAST